MYADSHVYNPEFSQTPLPPSQHAPTSPLLISFQKSKKEIDAMRKLDRGDMIDFVNNTLTISTAFEDATAVPYSEEYKLLQQIRTDFPNLTIVRKARRTPTAKKRNTNMTYANMAKYMSVFQNAVELLAQFEMVKRQSKLEKSPYQFVLT